MHVKIAMFSHGPLPLYYALHCTHALLVVLMVHYTSYLCDVVSSSVLFIEYSRFITIMTQYKGC